MDYTQWDNPEDASPDLPERCPVHRGVFLDELGYCSACEAESGYSDSQRLDEMNCLDDYNRFEEEQVFQDREWEDDCYEGDYE